MQHLIVIFFDINLSDIIRKALMNITGYDFVKAQGKVPLGRRFILTKNLPNTNWL